MPVNFLRKQTLQKRFLCPFSPDIVSNICEKKSKIFGTLRRKTDTLVKIAVYSTRECSMDLTQNFYVSKLSRSMRVKLVDIDEKLCQALSELHFLCPENFLEKNVVKNVLDLKKLSDFPPKIIGRYQNFFQQVFNNAFHLST